MRKVNGLLARIQFVDLARAIAVPRIKRKDYLRRYLERSLVDARMPSYEQFRRVVPEIYGVRRGFLDLEPLPFEDIEAYLAKHCHKDDAAMNISAATSLRDFLADKHYSAFQHQARDLYLSPSRKAAIRVDHYVVERGEVGRFQCVYPRREPINGDEIDIMLSLIHFRYVEDDFADFRVDLVDLSCPEMLGPKGGRTFAAQREPRMHELEISRLISRDDLQPEVQNVHDLLIEIGQEPEAE